MGFGDEREDGSEGRAAGYAKDVRVCKRIAQQGLKTGAGNGEGRSDKDAEDDARQTDVLNDQAVIAGDLAALAKDDAQQVTAKGIKRNRHGAELQGDDYDEKQNHQKDEALKKELAKC